MSAYSATVEQISDFFKVFPCAMPALKHLSFQAIELNSRSAGGSVYPWDLRQLCKQANLESTNLSIRKMSKAVAFGVSTIKKEEPFPVKNMRFNEFFTLFLFHNCLEKFDRLQKVKIINCTFPTDQLEKRYMPILISLINDPKIRTLKLASIRTTKIKQISTYKKERVEVPCDWTDFFTALLKNQTLTKLSLIDLGLGERIEWREMVYNLLLYNESIHTLNLSKNGLKATKKIF